MDWTFIAQAVVDYLVVPAALAVDVASGRLTRKAAARAAAEYARANVPGTLAKLAPAPAALDTMASAAVTAAVAQVLPGLAARGEGLGR